MDDRTVLIIIWHRIEFTNLDSLKVFSMYLGGNCRWGPCQLSPNASTTFFTHIVFFFQYYSWSFCHVLSVRFSTGLETETWWLVRNPRSELLKRKSPTITFSLSSVRRILRLHPLLGPFLESPNN